MAQTDSLSPREREVAELVAHGKSNRDIADALFITERTVESHVSSIFAKLDVHSRVGVAGAVFRGDATTASPITRDHVPGNNLPIQRTAFRGRERELAEIEELLHNKLLVTLTGAGGIGKTRLALQAGANAVAEFPDGVWFVELAALTTPQLVANVTAQTLGAMIREDKSADQTITDFLRSKKLLLILDNCEHLLEPSSLLVDAIMQHCPNVRVLATSRQSLGVSGETEHRLPALDLPGASIRINAADSVRYSATALFADRAKSADTNFSITDETAPVVAEICRKLDGMPLAIELAAARVKVLSIPDIARRLNERFAILTSDGRTGLPRHKTLRALIDWSYELLSPLEQLLFNRLGVFAGGFDLATVAAICGDGIDEVEILDLVASLADKSLVVAETQRKSTRYRLLETTRAYALEKLGTTEREQLARRHAEYFRDVTEALYRRRGAGSTREWIADAEVDLDNYRAALNWALADAHDVAIGASIAGALEQLWFEDNLEAEGRHWIRLAQAGIDEPNQPQLAARLWAASSWLYEAQRGNDAAARASKLYESLGDRHGLGHALRPLAFCLWQLGRDKEAMSEATRALAILRECGDKWGAAACLRYKAYISADWGDIKASRDLNTEALALYKEIGDETGVSIVVDNLGMLAFGDGNAEVALKYADEALASRAGRQYSSFHALLRAHTALYSIALGDLDRARKDASEVLHWARGSQEDLYLAYAAQTLALIAALGGQAHLAARLLGYSDGKKRVMGFAAQQNSAEKWSREELSSTLGRHLSDAEIATLATEGAAWSDDRAVEEALKI
jgi:predicted ATPase/DNA-binding CsgD family transcriptional regulator